MLSEMECVEAANTCSTPKIMVTSNCGGVIVIVVKNEGKKGSFIFVVSLIELYLLTNNGNSIASAHLS